MRALLITTDTCHEEAAVTVLWEQGTAGIEHRPSTPGRLALLSYFASDTVPSVDEIQAALGRLPDTEVVPVPVPDVDWVARFREGFRGFACAGFWVAPVWDVPADQAQDRLLIVDPGQAFGTGTHESTALCLGALVRAAEGRGLGRVLDVGTGSGILAVAALKLGARMAIASDLDPVALGEARRHSALNGVAPILVQADGGRGFAPRQCDTVVANLTAPLLLERAPELGPLPGSGGRLILAGLLGEDVPRVAAAYAAFGAAEESLRGEWAALTIARI